MANSFITNVNKLANELDSALIKLESIKTATESASTLANQAKNTATQASTSAQTYAAQIQEQLNREATNSLLGSVRLASDIDISNGTINKVITADKLKTITDNINNKLNTASNTTAGIIQIATIDEIKAGTGNNAVTPENIKHLTLSLNMLDYYTHQIIGSINYVKLKVSDTITYLQGFGRIITTTQSTTKIVFPTSIITQHVGINFNNVGNNNYKTIIEEITSNYCIVSIRDKDTNSLVQGTGSFTMQALIDDEVTPIAPVDVKATAVGEDVTIRWQD